MSDSPAVLICLSLSKARASVIYDLSISSSWIWMSVSFSPPPPSSVLSKLNENQHFSQWQFFFPLPSFPFSLIWKPKQMKTLTCFHTLEDPDRCLHTEWASHRKPPLVGATSVLYRVFHTGSGGVFEMQTLETNMSPGCTPPTPPHRCHNCVDTSSFLLLLPTQPKRQKWRISDTWSSKMQDGTLQFKFEV